MALPLMVYGLDKLHMFPVYSTRERYLKATGQEAPPFDPKRPPKFWFDPQATESGRRNVLYDTVIMLDHNNRPLPDAHGNPQFEPLVLTAKEAASVNIPYQESANEEGSGVPPVPVPLREPDPDEEMFIDKAGVVSIRNKKLWAQDASRNVFSAEDREVLRAIARKLGVPLSE